MRRERYETVTRFADRREAGELLATATAAVVRGDAVVGGIPRGGLAVAAPVAELLRAPLVPVYARKLPWPTNSELAFGAIDDDGEVIVDPSIEERMRPDPAQIESVRQRVWENIAQRRALYGASGLGPWIPGRTVVLVDDGLATGFTMRAALAYARRHGAKKVVVATPCASEHAARWFRAHADQFVALIVDPDFLAVGAYYDDFTTVEDRDVVVILNDARSRSRQPTPGQEAGREERGHGTQ